VRGREGRKGAEVVWGTATRTDTDKHGQARTASGGDGFTWNLEPCGEVRMQRSEVRGNRTAGTAEQPFNAKGANETQTTQAIFWGRGAQAGAKGRSAALSTPAQGRWMGWEGGGRGTEEPSALNERSYRTAELAFPVTWNLEPETEGNSHTDGHGRTRTGTDRKRGRWFFLKPETLWRGQRAEVRGQEKLDSRLERAESRGRRSGKTGQPGQPHGRGGFFHGVEKIFPWCGKMENNFSMVWKRGMVGGW
jgi:hypothetical protein